MVVTFERLGRRSDRGVTLMELLIVLVMVGVLVVLGIPRIKAYNQRAALDSAARQLAGDLRRTQVEAIRRNSSAALRRVTPATYSIDFVGTRALPGGVTITAGPDSVKMASFGPPISGVGTYTLQHAGLSKSVTVSAAGLVTVQ